MKVLVQLLLLLCSSFTCINGRITENEDFPISVEGWLSTSSNCSSPINTTLSKGSPSVFMQATANRECERSFSFDFDPNINMKNKEIGFRIDFKIEREHSSDGDVCPILFAIFEEDQISTVKLPYSFGKNPNSNTTLWYTNTGKTLCKSQLNPNGADKVIIRASTCSSENITFTIFAELINLSLRQENLTITVGPTTPQHLVYTFDPESEPWESVKVDTKSKSNDCMTVSIQNLSCPIFEQENNVKYTGYYKTMTTQSVMEIEKADFPDGFTVAFIVHHDNSECLSKTNTNHTISGEKFITVVLKHPDSDNAFFSILHFIIPLGIPALVGILTYAGYTYHDKYLRNSVRELSVSRRRSNHSRPDGPKSSVFLSDFSITSSESEGYISLSTENVDIESKDCSRDTFTILKTVNRHGNPNSQHFVGILLLISVFYAIPVYELAINFLWTLKGNYDHCFFNEECTYRLGGIADFNHFWSNATYLFFGLLFCMIVYKRGNSELFRDAHAAKGIPFQKEMFYSFGVALAMEGVFSAAYHLCPNRFTFQYDTTFMYVIASLTIIELFLSRHPVAYFTPYKIYWVLVVLVLITALSYLLDTAANYESLKHVYILYAVLQSFLILGFSIYYCDVGLIKDESPYYPISSILSIGWMKLPSGQNLVTSPLKIVEKRLQCVWKRDGSGEPFLFKRAIFPCITLLTSLVIFSVLINMNKGFASILLLTVVAITLISIGSYLFWKMLHGEFIGRKKFLFAFPGSCFIICSLIGFFALAFFFTTPYDPDDSPAISRSKNTRCTLSIYDNHDWWHMLSAISLFLGYMGLFTIDDGLVETPYEEIHVF